MARPSFRLPKGTLYSHQEDRDLVNYVTQDNLKFLGATSLLFWFEAERNGLCPGRSANSMHERWRKLSVIIDRYRVDKDLAEKIKQYARATAVGRKRMRDELLGQSKPDKRLRFTDDEDRAILDFMTPGRHFRRNDISLWKEAENQNLCPTRDASSMMVRYRRLSKIYDVDRGANRSARTIYSDDDSDSDVPSVAWRRDGRRLVIDTGSETSLDDADKEWLTTKRVQDARRRYSPTRTKNNPEVVKHPKKYKKLYTNGSFESEVGDENVATGSGAGRRDVTGRTKNRRNNPEIVGESSKQNATDSARKITSRTEQSRNAVRSKLLEVQEKVLSPKRQKLATRKNGSPNEEVRRRGGSPDLFDVQDNCSPRRRKMPSQRGSQENGTRDCRILRSRSSSPEFIRVEEKRGSSPERENLNPATPERERASQLERGTPEKNISSTPERRSLRILSKSPKHRKLLSQKNEENQKSSGKDAHSNQPVENCQYSSTKNAEVLLSVGLTSSGLSKEESVRIRPTVGSRLKSIRTNNSSSANGQSSKEVRDRNGSTQKQISSTKGQNSEGGGRKEPTSEAGSSKQQTSVGGGSKELTSEAGSSQEQTSKGGEGIRDDTSTKEPNSKEERTVTEIGKVRHEATPMSSDEEVDLCGSRPFVTYKKTKLGLERDEVVGAEAEKTSGDDGNENLSITNRERLEMECDEDSIPSLTESELKCLYDEKITIKEKRASRLNRGDTPDLALLPDDAILSSSGSEDDYVMSSNDVEAMSSKYNCKKSGTTPQNDNVTSKSEDLPIRVCGNESPGPRTGAVLEGVAGPSTDAMPRQQTSESPPEKYLENVAKMLGTRQAVVQLFRVAVPEERKIGSEMMNKERIPQEKPCSGSVDRKILQCRARLRKMSRALRRKSIGLKCSRCDHAKRRSLLKKEIQRSSLLKRRSIEEISEADSSAPLTISKLMSSCTETSESDSSSSGDSDSEKSLESIAIAILRKFSPLKRSKDESSGDSTPELIMKKFDRSETPSVSSDSTSEESYIDPSKLIRATRFGKPSPNKKASPLKRGSSESFPNKKRDSPSKKIDLRNLESVNSDPSKLIRRFGKPDKKTSPLKRGGLRSSESSPNKERNSPSKRECLRSSESSRNKPLTRRDLRSSKSSPNKQRNSPVKRRLDNISESESNEDEETVKTTRRRLIMPEKSPTTPKSPHKETRSKIASPPSTSLSTPETAKRTSRSAQRGKTQTRRTNGDQEGEVSRRRRSRRREDSDFMYYTTSDSDSMDSD